MTIGLPQYSPICHRVHIALEEAQIEYKLCAVEPGVKPDWYVEKVNSSGKVCPFGLLRSS